MPTIRKIGILVSIAFLSAASLTAESKSRFGDYGFSLSPLMGMLYGHSEENLYKYSNRDLYTSQLLWDLKPLIYTGLALDFGIKDHFKRNGLILAASLKYGLPLKTGIMEDRDWLYDDNEKLTNYSRHDAYSKSAILLDISGAYSWRISYFLSFSASLEFSYMYYSWSGENGYYQYVSFAGDKPVPGQIWSNSIPKIPLNGAVIQYTQNWFFLSPGISLKGRINRYFSAEGSFNYSPLIYVVARDDHLLAKKIFWDYCSFGHYVSLGGKFIFKPYNNLDLSVSLAYRQISGPRGKSYQDTSGQGNSVVIENTNDAGAAYSALELGFAAKVKISR